MELKEKLVALRKEKGLTQSAVTEKLDVSRQAISRWESGIALPSTDNLKSLSALYGVPIDYLLNSDVERERDQVQTDMSSTAPITVKDVRTAQVEIIERAEPTRMSAPAVTYGPTRWTSLGYVHYAKSRALGAETCAAVSARSADYYEDRYAIDTDVSKKVDNLVTFVAGTLIGTKLPTPTGGWLGVAQLLVEAAISAVGAEVIGDVVSLPFKEYYYCTVTEYELAGQVVGKGISGVKATLTGTKYSVEYQEDVFNDSYEGYTPNTWRTTEFARALWTGSMSNVAFPGYIGFPATYPL